VVANTFQRRIFAAVATVGAFFTMGMSPAFAASSAASADIAAPVRDAKASGVSSGDEQFKQLFASWESLDKGGPAVPAPITQVSIPSRMPLSGAALTSDFGMRTHPVLGGRRAHKGIDLAAPVGTPIYATADGLVSRADLFSSYGLYVQIEHGADLETRYAHMSRIAVAAGEHVKKGDIIGYVGTTGRSTGPHLHYEVRVDGEAVNPIPYMVESQAQERVALVRGEGGQGGD
jgi:murein DD-endopeptidase MepM/ murein hydrolase activator NlpD